MVSRDPSIYSLYSQLRCAVKKQEKKKKTDENQSKHLTSIAHRWRSEKKYEEKKSQ